VISRALEGDPSAVELVAEAGRWFGQGLAMLVDVLNPDRIVVGTLGVVLGDLLLEPARAVVQQEALPRAAAACQIVPAQLGSQIGDIAALMAGIVALRG
jgi:glucokinase